MYPQFPPTQRRSLAAKILDPGLKSPGPTLAAILPAIYFIVGDVMRLMNEAGDQAVQEATIKDIVMWVAVAAVGWFSRSHNVSSRALGIEDSDG